MKIVVIDMGYVESSLATLLSKENEVIAIDTNINKVELINNKISQI